MPHHKLTDRWWDDLPASGKKAAGVLGYTKETWDEDEEVPYDGKDFAECTLNEKCAALYIGSEPLVKKLNVYWKDVDEETKKQAQVLTWTPEKWDDDWEIYDLECEQWYWKDMTEEQRTAARHFGYTQVTWDGTGEEVFELEGVEEQAPDDDAEDVASGEPAVAAAPAASSAQPMSDEKKKQGRKKSDGTDKKKKNFALSRLFGGEGGQMWDHRNHKSIKSVEVFEKSIVNGIKVTYGNGGVQKAGSEKGSAHKFELAADEYINKVTVRSEKVVQELTFHTTAGKEHGPWGGHGRMLKDKKGEVKEVKAPNGKVLCGFMGREGKVLDAIAFRWGPAN